ncbi:sn-glycerol-3-phosphate ABC transporter ATP-binding protein UgpC [uncultured Paracoccus sp.]|uniref:sn-glycerol-3-phosphate ABC transporter ATP-binding protein UgpC n=1 Tax=uncultured Paracoccus sp. TaxID=189685 RepID=UPI002636EFA4|nr:sn-glycerol-3-phosphate ABC transporter ATP-binding protein UgpC [uncultured Paracoccus sp.]
MAGISLDKVGKVYSGNTRAVAGVDLDVQDGEFIVLVGPSGCGKSTLLRMVAGLETVSEGTIRIGDRIVNDMEPADRDIAMVFQNYALYPHMSVFDNLAYGLRNRGTPKAEIVRRVQEGARMLGLEPYLQRRPRALSGGQRQRVAMGRAIVREPAAFLFDEPLSNLDAKLRASMRLEIRLLQRRLGTTALYVTHDQVEAMTLADRLVVLNGGRVEQIGTPLQVYRNPASTFVAGFMGAPPMNLLPAAALPGLGPAATIIGFRPEDAVIDPAGEITLDVLAVEELGAQRLIHGRINGEPATLVFPAETEIGESLRLSIPASALRRFDPATGRAIPG